MFFWQASEEVEEERRQHMEIIERPRISWHYIRTLRLDNLLGMIASEIANLVYYSKHGNRLHSHGITNIATSADAAKALEPLVHTFPTLDMSPK